MKIINEIVALGDKALAQIENLGIDNIIKPLIKDVKLYSTYVSDIKYLEDFAPIFEVEVGDVLTMKKDSRWQSKQYVSLYTPSGALIGGIAEFESEVFCNLLSAGKNLYAKITQISTERNYKTNRQYGVADNKIAIDVFMRDF